MILKVIYGSEMNFIVCNVEKYVCCSLSFFFLIIVIALGSK